MKINYIQNKRIDYNKVEKYLNYSSNANHFTNNGPVKKILEDRLSEMINLPIGKKVLCVNNGTTALHAIMFYLNEIHGKIVKWATPAFTFPSCVVNYSNTEIFDIDENTYGFNHDFDSEPFFGVILTNLFGTLVPNVHSNKFTIYDNASSFMSIDNFGKNICLMGDISFSSLHHTKTLGFGEGGFIVLDEYMYDEIQRIIGFGFNLEKQFKINSSNFKMSDVSAALILQHIDNYSISKHLQIQNHILSGICNKNINIFNYSDGVFYGNIPLVFNSNIQVDYFRDNSIEANKYYKPLLPLPLSMNLYDKIINLPIYDTMTDEQIEYMIKIVNEYDPNN